MSDNLKLYNAVRNVPKTAQKLIEAGRLKGKTDINPMWRIKVLTEQFGPCGVGWRYKTTGREFVAGANGEIAVFVDIELRTAGPDGWSEPIPGSGGSMFVAKERNGLYTDDEAVKKATTDAISVACKALGVGADVYWDRDRTKYDSKPTGEKSDAECPICHKPAEPVQLRDGTTCSPRQFLDKYGMCAACYREKRTTGEKA